MSTTAPSRTIERPSQTSRRVLRFRDIELDRSNPGQIGCRVVLAGADDRAFVGEGTSVVLGSSQSQAAARATVHAIRAFADVPIALESCSHTTVGGRTIVVVVVTVPGDVVQDLAGAVIVRGDEARAAALAVLDATNRWLELRGREVRSFPAALEAQA